MTERPTYIVALTRFPFPSKEPFPSTQEISGIGKDENSEEGKIWHEGTTALFNAQGLKAKYVARIKEDPERILLFTTWESLSAYTTFTQSTAFASYLRSISMFGIPSLPQLVEFHSMQQGRLEFGPRQHDTISIRTVYFSSPQPKESRNARLEVPSFFPSGGMSGQNSGRPLLARWKNWVMNHEDEFEGRKDVESLLLVHWWNGFEREEWLMNMILPEEYQGVAEADGKELLQKEVGWKGLSEGEKWDARLKEAGALEWRDEHCQVTYFPSAQWSWKIMRKEAGARNRAAVAKGKEQSSVDIGADELS